MVLNIVLFHESTHDKARFIFQGCIRLFTRMLNATAIDLIEPFGRFTTMFGHGLEIDQGKGIRDRVTGTCHVAK